MIDCIGFYAVLQMLSHVTSVIHVLIDWSYILYVKSMFSICASCCSNKSKPCFLQQMRRYFSTACNKYVLVEGYFGQSHAMYTYILLVIWHRKVGCFHLKINQRH